MYSWVVDITCLNFYPRQSNAQFVPPPINIHFPELPLQKRNSSIKKQNFSVSYWIKTSRGESTQKKTVKKYSHLLENCGNLDLPRHASIFRESILTAFQFLKKINIQKDLQVHFDKHVICKNDLSLYNIRYVIETLLRSGLHTSFTRALSHLLPFFFKNPGKKYMKKHQPSAIFNLSPLTNNATYVKC